MARVTMTHPDLEHRIEVDEVSVPHYQASGWQVAESLPKDPTNTAAARSRRRTTKDES